MALLAPSVMNASESVPNESRPENSIGVELDGDASLSWRSGSECRDERAAG
jgi:hypothetical protein